MKKIKEIFNKIKEFIKKHKKLVLISLIILVLIIGIIIFFSISKNKTSPEGLTNEYMEKFNDLDEDVVKNIYYPFDDDLSKSQMKRYTNIIKKQYEKMTYTILDNNTLDNSSNITVQINVYDLKSAYDKAEAYINANSSEFKNDEECINYKLKQMEKPDESIIYNIELSYYKKNNKWYMMEYGEIEQKKIDGVF